MYLFAFATCNVELYYIKYFTEILSKTNKILIKSLNLRKVRIFYET